VGLGSTDRIADIVKELGATKVIIITDANLLKAGLIDKVEMSLDKAGCKYGIFDECQPDSPIDVVEKCSQVVREGGYDLLIGIGGGSVIDTTKIVSIIAPSNTDIHNLVGRDKIAKAVLPKILIPTTAGTGSEWSDVAIFTDTDGEKRALHNNQVWTNIAVIDPEMTLNLPPKITADSGMDALTHAIEAYINRKANILTDMFAETAIQLISENLRAVCAKGHGAVEARSKLSIAASLAAAAVGTSMVGLVHMLEGPVCTKTHLTHGAVCGILLPHVMSFHAVAIPAKFAKIAQIMGEEIEHLSVMDSAERSAVAVKRLVKDAGMPQKLSQVGVSKSDIPDLVQQIVGSRLPMIEYSDPREASREDIAQILRSAL
jgi:alcohol dehydrogenase class IV